MKKMMVILGLLLILVFETQATILLTDDFSYTAGTNLTANGWTAYVAGSPTVAVNNGGLTFSGFPGSGIGNAALITGSGEDVGKTFTPQSSGSVYASFMLKVNTIPSATSYFFHLAANPIGSSPSYTGKLWFNSGTNKLGISFGGTILYSNTALTSGSTYYIVIKYEIISGDTNDKLSLFIFDTAIESSEPATPAATTTNSSSTLVADLAPGSVCLRQGVTGLNALVDGVTVATSWREVIRTGLKRIGTGGDYTSLTGAGGLFSDINSNGLTSDLTAVVISDLSEDGTNALNQWAGTNTLNIQPDGNTLRTISGTLGTNSSLIRLNGADRVTIDGQSGKYLTFRNTNTTAANAGPVIDFNNGTTECLITNTTLESNSSSATKGVVLFNSTGVNSSNTISNCRIANPTAGAGVTHPANGFYFNSTNNTGNTISGCDIVNFGGSGINLTLASNTTVLDNRIYLDAVSSSSNLIGISISRANGTDISQNTIFYLNGGSSAKITGIGYPGTSVDATTVTIRNNMILLAPATTGEVDGVDYSGYSLDNLNMYFNSIYLGGQLTTGTAKSYAFLKRAAANTMNIKNNIFYNARTNNGGNGEHYAVGFTTVLNGTIDQNFNLLYSAFGKVGYYNLTQCTALTNWQSASSQDANSQSSILTFEAIPFTSGELKYERAVANAAVFNTGTGVGISSDFYGTPRPQYGLFDIGAYELIQSSDLTESVLPTENSLAQNYPNPFNPQTTIGFTLAKNATVNLTVYNTKGEVVKTLINNNLNAGFHSVNFNAVGLNSGVYVYKLTTPDNSITKKMILLK